jgi:hypothetical protein
MCYYMIINNTRGLSLSCYHSLEARASCEYYSLEARASCVTFIIIEARASQVITL